MGWTLVALAHHASANMVDKALVSNLKRDLGKAFRQLNTTHEVIHAEVEKYKDHQLGKPIIELVVTLVTSVT